MKKFTLILTALLMISFSVLAQIKMVVHLNDAESIEVYASSVDSITFTNFPVEPDDETPDDSDKPGDSEVEDEITLPVVEAPGEGYTTIVLYIPESSCEWAMPYILGELPNGAWENIDDLLMEFIGDNWWKVTVDALTEVNATNFKFRMEDGAGFWTYEPKGSYELLEDAADYLQIKADEHNNLVAIANCDNKVLYIKSGNWSTTPCEEQIPAGYAKFILNVIGDIPEDAEVIFTGNFEENSWDESDRVMTKEADGIYSWEGEYPENFRFNAFISNLHELDYDFEFYYSWLNSGDIYVESGAGSVIEFESCFMYFCPGDEVDDDDTEVVISTPSGYHNSYGYVDLGLPSGTKWATYNVGADSPEEYGDYFAWGETTTKSTYDWDTYKWCEGSSDTQTKYCTDSYYGTVDNKTILELSDDAANANWGGDWRMPTTADRDELRNYCAWVWSSLNGVKGYIVIGPNENSIFLPAAGCYYVSDLYDVGFGGSYWSSSLNSDYSGDAYLLYFDSSDVGWNHVSDRYFGRTVRPVLP